MKDYPLFIPPEHLASRSHFDWSYSEAKDYKDWLLSCFDERIENLLNYLDISEEQPSVNELFINTGRKVVEILENDDFSEETPTGRKLTNQGYAIAADMGLLVAKKLLEKPTGKIYWSIIRKPKREMSYHLPVLEGLNTYKGAYIDPIGCSVSEACSILRDNRDVQAWKKLYTALSKLIS